ncbi:transposase [Nostoc punctiforme NIES-2108]|uniref:Transposase n=1 Tax=Nostoc punctiforme NIES-2108 TaxID=1356359 RepID=A0A367S1K7_NOSPU|nr:transposase [Nostoc punctiforme NIES-2108]
MPAKGYLTQSQKENLQKALSESNNPQLTQKILMLLLMDDGKTYKEITDWLGCSYRSVAYWCVHGDPDNLESLKDGRNQGNYRKATEEYINLLMCLIEKEPSELGYEFGRWTTARLSTYLEEQTGIKLSGEQIRRILNKKKYAYLWAKYSLEDKQNPQNREAFKEKLQGYLEASSIYPDKIQVWFWDESGFSLRVIRRKNWGKKGHPTKVTGKRSRGRVNIMGGLRFHDKKRMCYFIEKGTGESFYEQLKQLNNFLKNECVILGNSESDFPKLGPKILIVLDNASYHKKKTTLAEIEKHLPNIQLYFLPVYSPDFNLVELVWHSAKEYISHRLFKSVDELKHLLERLLNQGELIIQWGRKIKNKGNAAIAN